MKIFFVYTLTSKQLSDIIDLYSQNKVVSLEQYPGFVKAIEPDVSVRYLLAYRQDQLIGYACVKIKKRILASVYFGPLTKDSRDFESLCAEIVKACMRKGVLIIKILPPYMSLEDSSAISAITKFKFEQSENDFNWASLKLSLDKPLDEILKNFSSNHRQSIKKALKLNFTVDVISDASDIDIFAGQYIRMYESRNLPISPDMARLVFTRLFAFYKEHNSGVFMAVRTPENGIVGGVCISFQGDSGFYQKGYSDPDHRSLPINHLAMYEAIRLSKENGKKFFDFGGYGLNLKEEDQVHAINRFKAWFGGDLVYYPQTLTIYTTPFSKVLYSLYRRLRKEPS